MTGKTFKQIVVEFHSKFIETGLDEAGQRRNDISCTLLRTDTVLMLNVNVSIPENKFFSDEIQKRLKAKFIHKTLLDDCWFDLDLLIEELKSIRGVTFGFTNGVRTREMDTIKSGLGLLNEVMGLSCMSSFRWTGFSLVFYYIKPSE